MKHLLLALILLAGSTGFAKSKPQAETFAKSCAAVWPVAKHFVTTRYVVQSLDDATMHGAFMVTSAMWGTRALEFSLTGEGDTCTVTAFDSFKKSLQNDKSHFVKNLAKELDRTDKGGGRSLRLAKGGDNGKETW